MSEGYADYIDEGYEPSPGEFVAEYRVTPGQDLSLEKVAENIARESSIGTWTTISTMNPEISEKLRPHIFEMDKRDGYGVVKIAYHQDLFEKGNMPQILSALAGNIFGMKLVESLRLLDIDFPDSFMKSFKGPQVGINGIRDHFGVDKRPLLGTIVKPKVGLNSEQHAEVAYKAWKGGLDLVKDDENLTSMSFNPFRRRIDKTMEAKRRAEKETGEVKEYMPNITAPLSQMKDRADYVLNKDSKYVMVDIITCGWSAFQEIRDYLEGEDVAIHCHRAGHAAFTRKEDHGISMLMVARIARMIGGDQLHIGTADVGKMEGGEDKVLEIEREIESEKIKEHKYVLSEDWLDTKKTLAVASGGLHPGSIPEVVDRMGLDIVAQFGGGCHGHPSGTEAGARAIRQALEATLDGKKLRECEDCPELQEAIQKWGVGSKR